MILDGKVGVITGAAQGIGRAYAVAAAQHGAKVTSVDLADSSETVNAVAAAGGEALGIVGDVTDEASMEAMVAATVERFGRIDFLVNNAGLYGTLELKYWEDISVDEWDTVMRVNVRGMFVVSKAVAPQMEAQRSGSIINISSGTALLGIPGALHYVTSKGAVIGFTRALARELGDFGIRVNTLTPGFTMSDASKGLMEKAGSDALADIVVAAQSFKRPEEPTDLVGAMAYLASDLSAFMTGQILNVNVFRLSSPTCYQPCLTFDLPNLFIPFCLHFIRYLIVQLPLRHQCVR